MIPGTCCMPSNVTIGSDPDNFLELNVNYTWPSNNTACTS